MLWAQMTYAALWLILLGVALANAGRPYKAGETRPPWWAYLIANGCSLFILYKAGAFSLLICPK